MMILEKIKNLEQQKQRALEEENFDQAKKIKSQISKIKKLGFQLIEIDKKKMQAIREEDYDSAKVYKIQMDKLKNIAGAMFTSPSRPPPSRANESSVPISRISNRIKISQTEQHKSLQKQDNIEEQIEQHIPQQEYTEIFNSYDEKIIPTLNKDKKKEIDDKQKEIPEQPEPLNQEDFRVFSHLIPIFGEKNTNSLCSKYWEYRFNGIKAFMEIINSQKKSQDELLMKYTIIIINKYLKQLINQLFQKGCQLLVQFLQSIQKKHQDFKEIEINLLLEQIIRQIAKKLLESNKSLVENAEKMFKMMIKTNVFSANSYVHALLNINIKRKNNKQLINLFRVLSLIVQTYDYIDQNVVRFCLQHINQKQLQDLCYEIVRRYYKSKGKQKTKYTIYMFFKLNNKMAEKIMKKIES